MLPKKSEFKKDNENDDLNEDGLPYGNWDQLPDLVLEKIFSLLSVWDRYEASQVCFSWYRAFNLPLVWKTFVLKDKTLTRRKYNYHSGWQHILDHVRTSQCLSKVGQHFKCLIFEPMLNFYNLYEFMNMLSYYSEQENCNSACVKGVGAKVKTLVYTFACNMASWDKRDRVRLYGTGGKLLEALKRLMNNLSALRWLELRDLMLDASEGMHLLDDLCYSCGETLLTLILVNTTEVPCQLLHVGVFINLQVLVISPQNLGDDVLVLIGQSKIQHLHILQNRFTPSEMLLTSASRKSWQQCRMGNPGLQVHLRVESHREREVLWQECAPVRSVLYDSPHVKVQTNSITTVIDLYNQDLRAYGHFSLPRFHRPRSFHERVDSLLLFLVRQCSHLNTLIVRERVSTATVLLLAKTGQSLNNLYVRRNAVILRCDWPRSPEWDPVFYEWLRRSSRSYESVEKEVTQILGHPWAMLSDKQFKKLSVDVQNLY